MTSLSPRVLSCALVVGLASGCASGTGAPRTDVDKPAPSGAPADIEKPAPSGSPTIPQPGTTVTSEDIDRAGATDDAIEKTLASRVPGILVTRTPDGGIAIRIRGNSSIGANTEPLFVIDGMSIQPGPGGALIGINPHDIASIEVLKDAASLSYYGVRAANGVVLIKTKHNTN